MEEIIVDPKELYQDGEQIGELWADGPRAIIEGAVLEAAQVARKWGRKVRVTITIMRT
jgi:hypothetical protein